MIGEYAFVWKYGPRSNNYRELVDYVFGSSGGRRIDMMDLRAATKMECPICHGSGADNIEAYSFRDQEKLRALSYEACTECYGRGWVWETVDTDSGSQYPEG